MDVSRLLPEPGAPRVLAVTTLVNTLGNGLFFTVSAVFLTRVVHLSPTQIGVGLTTASAVGLVANVPAGRLAEILGPREVMVAGIVLEGLAMAAYALVGSFASFLAIACLLLVFDAANSAVRGGLLATAIAPEQRVRTRAYLRSVTNLGLSIGALGAGLALRADTHAAYVTLILVDAATYFVAAAQTLRLPHVPPLPRTVAEGPRLVALRDRPYLGVVVMHSVLMMHNAILEVGVPLWVLTHTHAPKAVVAAVFVVNTVICVLFQVRVASTVHDLPSSARAIRASGVLLLAACVLFASSGGRSAGVAVGLLIVAELVHVTGELLVSAGGWGFGFGLAPEALQGQYQGLFSMSYGIAGLFAPVVITTVVIGWGWPGWLLFGSVLAGTAWAMGPVGDWAARNRPAVPALVEAVG